MLLFIGINSFVGRNFLDAYSGDLIGTYNKTAIGQARRTGVNFCKLDLTDYAEIYALFENNPITEVILASSVIYARNKKEFNDVNVAGVASLIQVMKIFGVERIVYLSTAILYNDEKIWGEYGRTKHLAEQLIIKSGLDYAILRPAEIYGPYEREGLGKLIGYVRHHKVVPLVNGGRNLLSPIHVRDICEILKICQAEDAHDRKIYQLAGGQKLSMREFVLMVGRQLGRKIILFDLPFWLMDWVAVFLPHIFIREQIVRAANTVAFESQEAEARFRYKFRKVDLKYLA